MTEKSVKRRRFLATVTTIGTAAIAGCGGGGDGGSTPTETATPSPTPTPTPTPNTPNEEAVEQYEAAIDALVQNKETLDEWATSSFEADRIGTLQDRVSTAREDLNAAEEAADPEGDLIGRIEQATFVVDFQALILGYYEAVTVFFQLVSEGTNLGDNELHQRAADTFAEAQAVLDDARQVIDDMGTVLEELDNDVLDEPDLEYTGEPLDHLDLDDRRAIDGADSFAVGRENVHLSFVQLEVGQEHYENEAFADARAEWETGLEQAQRAVAAFEDAIDNDYIPQDLRDQSITLLGASETIVDAFEKFVEGAEEAEAGNFEEANNLVSEGFNILGQL